MPNAAVRGRSSRETLSRRDQAVIWHPFTHTSLEGPPQGIVRAKGSWLIGEDGRQYLDAVSSWWVNLHGHCEPRIAAALAEQAHTLEHCIFAGFTHEPAVRLAELLLSLTPENQERVFFSDNGSTAVEVALKMAIQWESLQKTRPAPAEKRRTILRFTSSYHGDTFGAMSVSERDTFTAPFEDYLFEVRAVPAPTAENRETVFSQFDELCAREAPLAFLFEPLVQGAGGMLMHDAEALNTLLAIARERGVLRIADEVMTGFGRTGSHFATLQTEEDPDILCLSKGLTAGFLPLGATTCSREIYEAFDQPDRGKFFFHGHSYAGNPLACAVGVASAELLVTDQCQRQIQEISRAHERAATHLRSVPGLKNVRHTGTILAVDIDNGQDAYYLNTIRDTLYEFFLSRGLLLRPLGSTAYIIPPYCTTQGELELCYSAFEDAGRKFGCGSNIYPSVA
ncbi:adenosylmethionine--8-amino-7-oxononanoate transaminase [bacterium]|nr:adenosylmethionine--8-amino-7-oxononanoate transaminase [bacterium]